MYGYFAQEEGNPTVGGFAGFSLLQPEQVEFQRCLAPGKQQFAAAIKLEFFGAHEQEPCAIGSGVEFDIDDTAPGLEQ